jgi:FkbM family methyltransferase
MTSSPIASRLKYALRSTTRFLGFDFVRYPQPVSAHPPLEERTVLQDDSVNFVWLLDKHEVDLVFDIGAHVGNYANALFARGYRGRIVSFEPGTVARGELIRAAESNSRWEVAERYAIGDHDGEIEMQMSVDSRTNSILPVLETCVEAFPGARRVTSERVKMRSIDSIFSEYIGHSQAPFLKLDVQGYEDRLLAGAERSLPKIRGIQIELSLAPLYEGQLLFPEMLERLNSLGFELFALLPGFTDHRTGKLLQLDGVFFRTKG